MLRPQSIQAIGVSIGVVTIVDSVYLSGRKRYDSLYLGTGKNGTCEGNKHYGFNAGMKMWITGKKCWARQANFVYDC